MDVYSPVLRDFNPSGARIVRLPLDVITIFSKDANIEITPMLAFAISLGDATQFQMIIDLKLSPILNPNSET
jgi:hypothetical protein